MKNSIFLIFFSLAGFVNAQSVKPAFIQKIGYADTQLILSKIPEYNRIQNDLQMDIQQYENQFVEKVKEFEAKLKIYQEGASTMLEVVRIDKENELYRIQQSIKKFQKDVQVSLRNKERTLLSPVFDKVGRAIDEVARENGFTFVLNSSLENSYLIHFAEKKFDISEMVLNKLGVNVESSKP